MKYGVFVWIVRAGSCRGLSRQRDIGNVRGDPEELAEIICEEGVKAFERRRKKHGRTKS